MSRWEAWTFHILTLVVSASGAGYFWMKYLVQNDDPFSVVNHPWQPAMLNVHILAAPILILSFGMMINTHVLKKLRNRNSRANRVSGIVCLASFLLMSASGYGLQVVTSSTLTRALLIVHLATGGIFAGAYLAHQAVNLILQRSKSRQGAGTRLAA
jgi:hypothetical protein